MNYVDYILLVFLVIGFVLGFKDGLVRKVIGLIGLVLALYLAFNFSDEGGALITPIFNGEKELASIVAGITIFFLTILIVSILKRILHPVDKVNRFMNQLLGGISGLIQMIYFLSGLLILLSIFNFPSQKIRKESYLYTPVYKVLPVTIDLILGENSSAKQFIDGYIGNDNLNNP